MSKNSSKPWQSSDFWNERYIAKDVPWEMGRVSPTLSELSKDLLPHQKILVPGCGLGNDAIYFARLGHAVTVVDWSSEAMSSFRQRALDAQVTIETHCMNFWELPSEWKGRFDILLEHTFFCAIDREDRPQYIEVAARVLRPGGKILGAWFITENPKEPPIHPEGGPPFWTLRSEFEAGFKKFFQIDILEVSRSAPTARLNREWSGVLTRMK